MGKRELLVLFGFVSLIFLISFSSATCSVTFGKEVYDQKETITSTMTCSEAVEKNRAYTLTYTNESGSTIETDTGTTPTIVDTNFFETFIIPSDYVATNGTNITATLTGTNLEGSDFANVTTATTTSLILQNQKVTNQFFIGRQGAIEFEVIDSDDKLVNNAICRVNFLDANSKPVGITSPQPTLNGKVGFSEFLSSEYLTEGNQYVIQASCSCGVTNTSLGCTDEDGNSLGASSGSANFPITMNTWLSVNTLTGKSNYIPKEEIFICANVSSSQFPSRIPIKIFYQLRCSAGTDNDDDLDRALIVSDDNEPDLRGISNGTTQMQCRRFIFPEARYLEGRSSQCYASTSTWVLGGLNEELVGYHTTSPSFNITSDTLNIQADWEKIGNYTFNAIVNLSTDSFSDYNATGIGNIDIRLTKIEEESLNPSVQYGSAIVDLGKMLESLYIKSLVVKDLSGATLTSAIEFVEDGHVELEIRSVNLNKSGWFNLTLEFNSWDERQSTALEGIENKTGTFHFDIDCPSQAVINQDMNCTITAQVEDSQIVEKEVDFTCWIEDGNNRYSQINFNQMVTRTPYVVGKTFLVPPQLSLDTAYVLQCKGDYYNLGSRSDSFFDTFVVVAPQSSSAVEQQRPIFANLKETIEENVYYVVTFIFVCLIIFLCILGYKIRKSLKRKHG